MSGLRSVNLLSNEYIIIIIIIDPHSNIWLHAVPIASTSLILSDEATRIAKEVRLRMNNGKRPDGATLMAWARGKPTCWDVTIPEGAWEVAVAGDRLCDRVSVGRLP